MHKHRIQYIFILAITVALVVLYVDRRQLQARYEEHLDREQAVETTRADVVALEQTLEVAERRTAGLESDPLELEAAIRRINRGVRENEKMYRIEVDPAASNAVVEESNDDAELSEAP